MLLIAQPRTASTSLMTALGEITGLEALQKLLGLPYERHVDWQILTHSDMKILPISVLYNWIVDEKRIYKQHILPVKQHLDVLLGAEAKYVLLLREPQRTIESYTRIRPSSRITKAIREGNEKQVLKEVRLWHERAVEMFFGDQFLHVWFDDLIRDQSKMVNIILEFYGFWERVGRDFVLPKVGYSERK